MMAAQGHRETRLRDRGVATSRLRGALWRVAWASCVVIASARGSECGMKKRDHQGGSGETLETLGGSLAPGHSACYLCGNKVL